MSSIFGVYIYGGSKMKHKDQILKLREQGKSYNEIHQITGASKGTIAYHCGKDQKKKCNYRKSHIHPFVTMRDRFLRETTKPQCVKYTSKSLNTIWSGRIMDFHRNKDRSYNTPEFTLEELKNKIGDSPICYLTGEPIDIYQRKTYQFDHIIPRSRGGTNSLDNLGITTKQANQAKNNLTYDEFLELCVQVVQHAGYSITK